VLPPLNLPVSVLGVLMAVRPCFTAPSFTTFCGLVAGLAGQVCRTVPWPGCCWARACSGPGRMNRAHYFFSRARWQIDELGLAVARLVTETLVSPGADVTIALDDPVRVRAGRKVRGTGWQHDGSAKNRQKLSFGNCFVTVGIVVELPFCSRSWCLPVLARLHLPGKGAGPSKVTVAAELVALLAAALPGRRLSVVADAAYHGPALRALPANVTWTCRLPKTAVLYGLAPPRTGRRGRPRTRGERLGTPADLARNAAWTTHHVVTYHGRTDIRHIAAVRCLWYGSFHARAVTVVLVRDQDTASGYDLALVTTDDTAAAGPALIVSRYAMRWSVEQAFAGARNVLGAGEARNRSRLAVERTVPFALPVHTLIVVWYARHGYDQADIDARRDDQPWYGEKTEPAFEDMLVKLRRVMIAARFSAPGPAQPTTDEIRRHLSLSRSSGLIPRTCESRDSCAAFTGRPTANSPQNAAERAFSQASIWAVNSKRRRSSCAITQSCPEQPAICRPASTSRRPHVGRGSLCRYGSASLCRWSTQHTFRPILPWNFRLTDLRGRSRRFALRVPSWRT